MKNHPEQQRKARQAPGNGMGKVGTRKGMAVNQAGNVRRAVCRWQVAGQVNAQNVQQRVRLV